MPDIKASEKSCVRCACKPSLCDSGPWRGPGDSLSPWGGRALPSEWQIVQQDTGLTSLVLPLPAGPVRTAEHVAGQSGSKLPTGSACSLGGRCPHRPLQGGEATRRASVGLSGGRWTLLRQSLVSSGDADRPGERARQALSLAGWLRGHGDVRERSPRLGVTQCQAESFQGAGGLGWAASQRGRATDTVRLSGAVGRG